MKTLIVLLLFSTSLRPATVVEGAGYFPVMIKLKNGDALSVYRAGAAHVGVKGRLDMVRSTDGGKTWSTPWIAVDGEFDHRNPALGQLKDGTIVLAYSIASNYDATGLQFKGTRKDRVFDGVYLVRSKDDGKTWTKPQRSEPIHKFYEGRGVVSPYGKIVQMKVGTVLMAVYFEFWVDMAHESYLFRSHDDGLTWGEPSLIGRHYNETGITVLPNGDILAAVRSEKGGHLAITHSTDQGKTFSVPEQLTADLEHPADLIVLKDGRILLTFGERNAPRGIHALLSKDGGKSWDKANQIVLAADAPNFDCGYPSSVELSKGKILTIYYQVDDAKNTPTTAKAKSIVWTLPQ